MSKKRTLLYRLLALLVVTQMAVPALALAWVGPAGESVKPSQAGLYRTNVMLRSPRDLVRLKELEVVMLEEKAADQRPVPARVKDADSAAPQPVSSCKSAVVLADEDQPPAWHCTSRQTGV